MRWSFHDVLRCQFANCKQLASSLDTAHLVMQTLIDKELISVYGMHEEHELRALRKEWANPMLMFQPQPLERVKRYFGPTICIYFAWLGTLPVPPVPLSLLSPALLRLCLMLVLVRCACRCCSNSQHSTSIVVLHFVPVATSSLCHSCPID